MIGVQPAPLATSRVLNIAVEQGPVPPRWEASITKPWFCGEVDRALVTLEGSSVYVANGDTVVIDCPDPQQRSTIDYLIYAQALRLALIQRDQFCMHASVVRSPNGQTVAITGESMAGKSTATIGLLLRGWSFVCDDVAEVEVSNGRATLVPHERPVHLSDAALRLIGADPQIGRELPGRQKRVVSLEADLRPGNLDHIVRLIKHRGDDVLSREVGRAEAISIIGGHSECRGLCQLPQTRPKFFEWTTGIAKTVPVSEVSRPVQQDSYAGVVEAIAAAVGQ